MTKFEVDETTDKKDLGGEPGKCPYCGSENVEYGMSGPCEGEYYYEANCYDCDNKWREYFTMTFNTNYGYPLKATISEVEDDGDLLSEYPVDESQQISNAGAGELYSYKGRKYEIITWNTEAMEHEDGEQEISEILEEEE